VKCRNTSCSICYPQPESQAAAQPEVQPEAQPEAKKSPEKEPPRYDEQLQLVGSDNRPACDLFYIVKLSDGSGHSGFTNDQGLTTRFVSKRPTAIESITLEPSGAAWKEGCCMGSMAGEKLVMRLYKENLSTHDREVGTSVAIGSNLMP
jgi:hypothetical protein